MPDNSEVGRIEWEAARLCEAFDRGPAVFDAPEALNVDDREVQRGTQHLRGPLLAAGQHGHQGQGDDLFTAGSGNKGDRFHVCYFYMPHKTADVNLARKMCPVGDIYMPHKRR